MAVLYVHWQSVEQVQAALLPYPTTHHHIQFYSQTSEFPAQHPPCCLPGRRAFGVDIQIQQHGIDIKTNKRNRTKSPQISQTDMDN